MNCSHSKSMQVPVIVPEEHAGQRIDNFLTSRLKGLPKSRLYRALRSGEVRVNHKRVQAGYRLEAGDVLRLPPLRVSSAKPVQTVPQKLAMQCETSVLFEDARFLVVNKPSGFAVHGGSGVQFGLVETWRLLRPEARCIDLGHRLDRETTGCIVLAKKPSVLKGLHELFAKGAVRKIYWALLAGHWPARTARIDAPLLGRILRSGERMVAVHSEGKAALTEFRLIQTFADYVWVEVRPQTGRMHQIRVHARHMGHSILGDQKYGLEHPVSPVVPHLMLHARSIEFEFEEKVYRFEAQPDVAFGRLIGRA